MLTTENETLNPAISCGFSRPQENPLPEHHAPVGVDDPFTGTKKTLDTANQGL